jgi:hypothetical protein
MWRECVLLRILIFQANDHLEMFTKWSWFVRICVYVWVFTDFPKILRLDSQNIEKNCEYVCECVYFLNDLLWKQSKFCSFLCWFYATGMASYGVGRFSFYFLTGGRKMEMIWKFHFSYQRIQQVKRCCGMKHKRH